MGHMDQYHGRDFYHDLLTEDYRRRNRFRNLGIAFYIGVFGWLAYQLFDLASRWHFLGWVARAMATLD